MKKTFWSVTYSVYGGNHTRILWFKTKEEAEKYAGGEHSQPHRHTYRSPIVIEKIEHIINQGGEEIR